MSFGAGAGLRGPRFRQHRTLRRGRVALLVVENGVAQLVEERLALFGGFHEHVAPVLRIAAALHEAEPRQRVERAGDGRLADIESGGEARSGRAAFR